METAFLVKPGRRISRLLAALALAGMAQAAAAEGDFWITSQPLPTPRRLLAAAAEGDAIYTFGGCGSPCFDPPLHSSTSEETRLEVYRDGSWSVRRPIPAILFGSVAAAPGNGKIYLFGGFVTGDGAYEYNPSADAWSRKTPMPTPRHGLAAVALGGKAYVLGGSDGGAPTGALEVYDPAADSWRSLAPMPTPRVYLAAAALNGRIYAIGGSPDCCGEARTDAVEVYDPGSDSWSRAAPLPVALQTSAAAAVNGRIYVLGGFIPGVGIQGSTFEYDPAADAWTERASMPDPRDQAPAVVLDGTVHVLGGSVDCHCKARDADSGYTPLPPPESPGDLALAVSGPASLTDCGGLSYTFRVTNPGPGTACAATLQIQPPKGSRLLSISAPCSGLSCPLGNLAPGAAVPIAARLSLPAGLHCPRSLSTTAVVSGCNRATKALVTRVPCVLAVTKTDGLETAHPGDPILYTIGVENRGCAAVSGVAVRDPFPGLQNPRWCRGADCAPSRPGPLADTLALPAGGAETYRASGAVPPPFVSPPFLGDLINTVTVTPPGSPPVSATDVTRIEDF